MCLQDGRYAFFSLIYTLLRWSPLTAELYLSSGKTRGKLELGPGFTGLALTGNNDLTIYVYSPSTIKPCLLGSLYKGPL